MRVWLRTQVKSDHHFCARTRRLRRFAVNGPVVRSAHARRTTTTTRIGRSPQPSCRGADPASCRRPRHGGSRRSLPTARSQSTVPVCRVEGGHRSAQQVDCRGLTDQSRCDRVPGTAKRPFCSSEGSSRASTVPWRSAAWYAPWVTPARRTTRFQVLVRLFWAGLVTRRHSSKGFMRSHPSLPGLPGAIPGFVSLVKASQARTTSVFRILARLTPNGTSWPVGAAFLAGT